jgi:WD domain, G-beta repeat
MTDDTVGMTVTGGQIQGVAGADTVRIGKQAFINNYFFHDRPREALVSEAADGEPIGPCPYPGLEYFGPDDADRFFGRDEAIGKLAAAVGRQSLTALVGASGSGKSSVVLAGLAPRLHQGGGWLFSYFRIANEPDGDLFLALARALVPFYVKSTDETERLVNTRKLAEKLRSNELTLRDVFADCRGQNKGSRILLIADQFEEAFTLVQDDANRNHFIDVLLGGFPNPAPRSRPDICLVLTLRADFYGRALLHRSLADALQDHVENLGPMNRGELRTAIVRPAEDAKVSFEPGLVETLLDDVESKPGSLPLLQFALREMWQLQEHGKITRKSYDALGGVQGALAKRAETIFSELTANDARTEKDFQRLFTRLVTPGEGQEDTRRVAEHQELGDEVWLLAQRLAGEDNRLVVTNAPTTDLKSGSHETAEVVHEALIRHWPRLAGWINRDRAFLSWRLQIKSNVELWTADPTDEAPLLRGGMLARAEDWLAARGDELSPAERAYFEASLAFRRRAEEEKAAARQAELRRQRELAEAATKLAREQRRRASIAGVGAIVALVLAVLAGWGGLSAYWNAQKAVANEQLAKEAATQAQVERDRLHAQLLAVEARRASTDPASADDIERTGALALASIAASRAKPVLSTPEADAIEAAESALANLPLAILLQGYIVTSLAVLPDGRLASGGTDGKIRLWPREGAGQPVVLTQGSWVRSLAVLPDGRLASGGGDGKIRLWPKEGTGEPVVLTHGGEVTSLAVLPDGRLASGGDDGKIRLWIVDERKLVTALCLRAGRNLSRSEWARYIGADTPWQPSCAAFGLPSNWVTSSG